MKSFARYLPIFLVRSTFLILFTFLQQSSSMAAEQAVAVGVNLSNPHRLKVEDRIPTLDALQRAGVKMVRMPLVDDVSFDLIQGLHDRGIAVLLILTVGARPDAPQRPADKRYPWVFSGPPLSDADPALFEQRFQPQLERLEAMGVKCVAFELGNEINWPPFNGEFPIEGEGKNLSLQDLYHDPVGQHVAKGFRNYLQVLAVLKRLRDSSKLNHDTPIISAGLADAGIGPSGPQDKLDAVSIPVTLQYLRQNGVDRLVDGYGVHTYPDGRVGIPVASRAETLRKDVLSVCRDSSGGKPCWITEWGVPNNQQGCPINDEERAQTIAGIRNAFQIFADDGQLAGLFYYSWSGEPWSQPGGYDIYRCGNLTKAGQVALAPMSWRPR